MRIVLSHEARRNLDAAADAMGASHASLSKVLRRSPGYVGRHIREGVPALLADHDAKLLADYLGRDAREFGVVGAPRHNKAGKGVGLPWWKKPMPRF